MEPKFINEVNITFELYKYWAKHPMGKRAVRSRKTGLVLQIILAVCGLFLSLLSIFTRDFFELICGLIFLMIALSRLFILPDKMLKRQYRLILKSQNTASWVRKTIFSDEIICEEGNSVTRYRYSDITGIKEDEHLFYLFYINEDMVIRICKDGFVLGTADAFRDFCNSFINS